MSSPLKQILDREMSRKQFLMHLGGVALAVTGVAGLLKALTSLGTPHREQGYGSTAYGGNANGAKTGRGLPR